MHPLSRLAGALALIVAALSPPSGASLAQPLHDPSGRWLAAADVVSLVARRLPEGGMVRALVLDDGARVSLVIETLRARARPQQGSAQVFVREARVEGRFVPLDRARAIDGLAFQGRGLSFSLALERGTYECRLRVDRDGQVRSDIARCGGGGWDDDGDWSQPPGHDHPGPQPPPPLRPRWSQMPEVIQACGAAFTGQTNEIACLDRVDRFRVDPRAAISACEHATTGDDNALACLSTVERLDGDATPLVHACEHATTGDDNLLRCANAAQGLPLHPSDAPAVIAACESSTTGDENMLRCVDALRGTRGDAAWMVERVRACDAAMTGDEAMIACIAR